MTLTGAAFTTGAGAAADTLKNHTSKMELCIEQLKIQLASGGDQELPEEIAILSRSISSLKHYVDRMKRHSQTIRLLEESCNLADMLGEAMPASLTGNSSIDVRVSIDGNVFWVCDKAHMIEVFSNILTNAAEAIRGSGSIEISGAFDKSDRHYLFDITDTGVGMDEDELPPTSFGFLAGQRPSSCRRTRLVACYRFSYSRYFSVCYPRFQPSAASGFIRSAREKCFIPFFHAACVLYNGDRLYAGDTRADRVNTGQEGKSLSFFPKKLTLVQTVRLVFFH